eukprot:scaffold14.g1055.t1
MPLLASASTCRSSFYVLPSVNVNGRVYLLTVDSAALFCRERGHTGVGSTRNLTLARLRAALGEDVPAYSLAASDACGASCPAPAPALVGIECLPAGAEPCQPDTNGNIGIANRGYNNWGVRNSGRDNIGITCSGVGNIGVSLSGVKNVGCTSSGRGVAGQVLSGAGLKRGGTAALASCGAVVRWTPSSAPPTSPAPAPKRYTVQVEALAAGASCAAWRKAARAALLAALAAEARVPLARVTAGCYELPSAAGAAGAALRIVGRVIQVAGLAEVRALGAALAGAVASGEMAAAQRRAGAPTFLPAVPLPGTQPSCVVGVDCEQARGGAVGVLGASALLVSCLGSLQGGD